MKEIWREIAGYAGIYSVSNLGRVRRDKPYRSTTMGRILKPQHDGKGYLMVGLYLDGLQSKWRVHRLVATTFCGPRMDRCINHKDGDKHNNREDNLEFVTFSENTIHAYENGLIKTPPSERCSATKLTKLQVERVCWEYAHGFSQAVIAKAFNVSQTAISKIILRKTWKS